MNYDEDVASAKELIAEFGKVFQLSRETDGVFDPVSGHTTGTITEYFNLTAVRLNYKNKDVDGSLIKNGDVMFLADATTEPQNGDVIDGYVVVDFKTLQPADTVILYKIQARR